MVAGNGTLRRCLKIVELASGALVLGVQGLDAIVFNVVGQWVTLRVGWLRPSCLLEYGRVQKKKKCFCAKTVVLVNTLLAAMNGGEALSKCGHVFYNREMAYFPD